MPDPGNERSRFWPTLAAVLGISLTLALGYWQLGRGAAKRELKARFEAQASAPPISVGSAELTGRDIDLRRTEARGVFEPRYAVFVDNRIHKGTPGYHVVMPLRVERSARYLLVNRGWIARRSHRNELPEVSTPSEAVTVTGVATIPPSRVFELSREVIEGPIWQNITLERYRHAMPIEIQPFIVRQENEIPDGLVRAWPAPDFGIEKHYGYAFQWFALAATIVVFYAVTQFRRKRHQAT